jgi:hypothetical protein
MAITAGHGTRPNIVSLATGGGTSGGTGSTASSSFSGGGTTSFGTGSLSPGGILGQYEKSYEEARKANELRYQQGLGILDKAIERYQPGGGFGEGAMSLYEQGKTQALASGMQNLVSSGLSNTTIAGGLPLAYEQEVGTPFRLQLEDMRMQNLTGAEQAKAGFIEGRYDPYPDFGMFAQLAMQSAMQSGGTGGGVTRELGPMAQQGLDIFGQPLSGPGSYFDSTGSGYEPGGASPGDSLQSLMDSMYGGGGGGVTQPAQGSMAVQPGTTSGTTSGGTSTTPMSQAELDKLTAENEQRNKTYDANTMYKVDVHGRTRTMTGEQLNFAMKASSTPEIYKVLGSGGGTSSGTTSTSSGVTSGYGGNIYSSK